MASENATKTKLEPQEVEYRLRERERFLRTLISNLPGVVFRCRADENFTKELLSDGCFDLDRLSPRRSERGFVGNSRTALERNCGDSRRILGNAERHSGACRSDCLK